MVTPSQISVVQSTWAKVVPIADTAVDLFYTRLFELDPRLRLLFPAEMADQKKKLLQTLSLCVNGLTKLEEIVPAVEALGRRHVDYQVREEHYTTVGEALLWTLEQGLGDDFTPEAEEAWTAVYGVLSSTMIAASKTACV